MEVFSMKWLQEEARKGDYKGMPDRKFVRFTKGKGANKNATHMYVSKSLFVEAEEKGFKYVRLGTDVIEGNKVLGFNFSKNYGGLELKNKNNGWKKVFNINGFLKGYEDAGIELPFDEKLDLIKEGQNYIYYIK